MDIGANVKHYRIEKRMTQEKLAEASNLSVSYISQVESGRKDIGIRAMEKIANALNISLVGLICSALEDDEDYKMQALLSDCTKEEKKFFCDTVFHMKASLRANMRMKG